MRLYFPQIYPDELVYSWFSRYFVYSGCISNKMAISQLYCSAKHNPSIEFVGRLNDNAKFHIEEVCPIEELIIKHSMFPEYGRFLTQDKREAALMGLKNYCNPRKVLTILPRSEKEKYLRYCPMCVKDDRTKYGETYWHRKHQLRNVRICPIHQCILKDSDVLASTEKSFTWVPAELSVKETEPVVSDNKELIAYSRYVAQIFDTDFQENHNIAVSPILYGALDSAKYRKGKHRNMAQFTEDLQMFYERIGLNGNASIHQIQRVFIGGSSEFSVICQIAYFLNISRKDLLNPEITEEAINLELESHYIKNRPVVDWQKCDYENAPLLETFCKNIYNGAASKTGRPERVSARMVYKMLGVTSYGFANLPKCQRVFNKYKESYEESNARKIVWAYQKIISEKKGKVYFFDIRKLSGVKKDCLPSLELIEKYSNKETSQEIYSLI